MQNTKRYCPSHEKIRIVADESVDYSILKKLRLNGFETFAICEANYSMPDDKVLSLAVKNNATLITEDKDFGELVYRFKMKHCGILLIRLIDFTSDEKANLVLKAVTQHYKVLKNIFSPKILE